MQERLVRFRVHEGVAIVTMNGASGTALDEPLRAGLWEAFGTLCDQPDVRAVVLCNAGPQFSAGLNLREADLAREAEGTARLCRRIEECPRPVVAALQGRCLGAGADLALACHYRIADPEAELIWPEVTLGLTPVAGGCQRLTRMVGADPALATLIRGQAVPAGLAQRIGLVDGIVRGDLVSGAVAFARSLAEDGQGPRPASARRDRIADGRSHQQAVAKARTALAGSALQAPARIVDCIEAAGLLPYDAALAFERDALERCLAHPQHLALHHVFIAERSAPAALLEHGSDGFRPTEAGRGLVARLRRAWGAAAEHLVGDRRDRAAIDGALVAYGFRKGPFDGRDPGTEDPELVRRMIAALVVEGAAIIDDHVIRPATVDALAVHGMGFPRRNGGPFRAAQTFGLLGLRSDMRGWAADSALWAPPRLLDEAIKDSRGFDAL